MVGVAKVRSINLHLFIILLEIISLAYAFVGAFQPTIRTNLACRDRLGKRQVAVVDSNVVLRSTGDGEDGQFDRYSSTIGSDSLYRPDDEDSPEFQEYLKKLLKMQSNRARAGFSAPSSRSTDAYFAKLNRLKLEKLARFRAGLPDEPLDASYKDVDYQNAVYESADVAVTAVAAGGGAGPPSAGRVRPISPAEMQLAKLAEEAAQKAAAAPQTMPVGEPTAPAAAPPVPTVATPVISEVTIPPVKKVSPVEAVSTPPPRIDGGGTSAVSADSRSAYRKLPVSAPAQQETAPAEKSAASAAVGNVQFKCSIDKNDLEIAGKALQMAVMHRGGGPFGSGRLRGDKLQELVSALEEAFQMLAKDSALAELEVVKPKPSARELDEQIKLPLVPKATAPSKATTTATVAATPIATSSGAADIAIAPVSGTTFAADVVDAPQTIAQGLDAFLLKPSAMTADELSELRFGLLQCITMIEAALDTAMTSQQQHEHTDSSDSASAPVSAAHPTERIIAQQQSSATSDSRELKIALGLLLKHRGGPGFGHGRLTGKELDTMESKLRSVAATLASEASATA